MKRLPHWQAAALGMRIGLARMALYDVAFIRALGTDSFVRMQRAQTRYMVAVAMLEDFSTRDYAYDRGGEQISDAYLDDYRYAIWENDGTT